MVKALEKIRSKSIFTKKGDGLDTVFLIVLLFTLAVGLCALFTASYAVAASEGLSSFHYVQRQALFMVIGIVGMYIISRIDYHVLKINWVPIAFLLGSMVLIIVTLLSEGDKNGIKRWIVVPGLGQFQPTEIAKFAIILWYSYFLDKNYNKFKDLKPLKQWRTDLKPFFKYIVLQLILPLGVVAVLILKQPHLSCTILIGLIALSLMFVGGVNKWFFGLGFGIGAIAVAIIAQTGYFADRIASYIDPFADPTGDGWQIIQSLYAIGSGGFFGVGLGDSRQKYSYVPEPENDFIFSIICEETGFLGAIFVISLFVMLVFLGFRISVHARDRFGALLTFGTSLQIGIQALINIAVVSKAIPNTGISLPFFSSGGTSLMMLLLQVGVVLSVSRTSAIKKI